MNWFCAVERKILRLFSSRDHCWRHPSLQFFSTSRTDFETVKNVKKSSFFEWSYAVLVSTRTQCWTESTYSFIFNLTRKANLLRIWFYKNCNFIKTRKPLQKSRISSKKVTLLTNFTLIWLMMYESLVLLKATPWEIPVRL